MKQKEPYAVVINFSVARIWGKVGPFKGWKEVHEWCVEFRKKSRAQDVDITAISGEVLGEVVPKLPQQEYLPSRDVEEIINHAVVKSLFGF
jgi:hypothetical protein